MEYSIDGVKFKEISKIQGNGTTSGANRYHYSISQDIFEGMTYFHLKQTDFAGNYTYSDVTQLYFEGEPQIIVYPNPISDVLFISIDFSEVRFFVIHYRTLDIEQKTDNSFNVSNLRQGLYFIQITQNGTIQMLSFVKE